MMNITTPTWYHGATINFQAPSRNVHTVFVHCSASDRANHDDVSVMRHWHVNGNGWNDVGYHYFITKAGDIQTGRPVANTPAAQAGHNTGTIAICLHGLKEELFTQKQFESLLALCQSINAAYPNQQIRFRGHREVSTKACPVFKYKVVLGLNGSGYMTGSPNTAPPTSSPPVPLPPRADKTTQILDNGKPVLILQSLLVLLGANLQIDGIMGQVTAQALKAFQQQHSLLAENGLDAKTRDALIKALNRVTSLKKPDKGQKVKALQQLLKLAGVKLTVDGDFGNKTHAAVEQFQTRKQLTVDGVADATTQQALARELLG